MGRGGEGGGEEHPGRGKGSRGKYKKQCSNADPGISVVSGPDPYIFLMTGSNFYSKISCVFSKLGSGLFVEIGSGSSLFQTESTTMTRRQEY